MEFLLAASQRSALVGDSGSVASAPSAKKQTNDFVEPDIKLPENFLQTH